MTGERVSESGGSRMARGSQCPIHTPGTFSVQRKEISVYTPHMWVCVRGRVVVSLMEKSWLTDTCRFGWTLDGDRL